MYKPEQDYNTTGLERWSTGNCARDKNLTITIKQYMHKPEQDYDTTGWKMWSTGNCERDKNLTITIKWYMHKPEQDYNTTGWKRWSTGNCARDKNLSITIKWYMHKPEQDYNTTGWKRWSTGNCAKDKNLSITIKCYMHEPEFVLKNEMHNILKEFEKQTDHLIPTRRPNFVFIIKEKSTCHLVDFVVRAACRVKIKENEKINEYVDLARELKSFGIWEWVSHELVVALGTIPKSLDRRWKGKSEEEPR